MVVLVRLQGDARSSAARSEVQGLAATIERDPSVARVVDFYNTRFNIALTNRERTDLVAFLKSLPYEKPPDETPNTVKYRVAPKKE